MPFVPAANTAGVVLRQTLDSQLVINTLYFELGGGWSAAELTTLAGDVADWWLTNMKPLLSFNLNLNEVSAVDLSSATGPGVTFVVPPPNTGDINVDTPPTQVALCVSFRTEGRGRSSRGRNYVSGIPALLISRNFIQPDFVEDVVTAYTAIEFGGSFTSGGVWSIVSRFSGTDSAGDPIPRATAVVQPVTAVLAIDTVVDSQRRRAPKRGV